MRKDSRPRTYSISQDVHLALTKLRDMHGSFDNGLRTILFAEPIVVGQFALIKGVHRCKVTEKHDFGLFTVALFESGAEVIAKGRDLMLVPELEALDWKLTQ